MAKTISDREIFLEPSTPLVQSRSMTLRILREKHFAVSGPHECSRVLGPGQDQRLSQELDSKWKSKAVEIPSYKTPDPPAKSQVYFYDVPDAKQSVIRIGYPALAQIDKDFYPATVMNYILGGGGFASRLTQELRESKGYTYGINSGFAGTHSAGHSHRQRRCQE